ncbi:DUF7344 domain-containing protein [Haloglomus halophilum]|uniref:DUF7344 domain-containing protein n=1 Tax=Haloglomus halophilum TaxID=2962672 RepID=UPI0020CA1BF6|nr:hypothetical protein [Haloglomus halophilum]
MGETSSDLGPETALDLLSASRRLAAVVAVEEADEPVSSGELATMTAAAEHGRSPGRLGGRSTSAVKSDLESDHLPRLVAHDVLRDAEGGYEAGANLDNLLSVVDVTMDECGAGRSLRTSERQPGDAGGPAISGGVRDTDI